MNPTQIRRHASKYAVQRALRFNLWALVAIVGLTGYFVAKAAVQDRPDHHTATPAASYETWR